MSSTDLVTQAAEPIGEVAVGWRARAEVARQAQRAHEALYAPDRITGPSVSRRRALARRVAEQHGAAWLARHHDEALARADADAEPPGLLARHADLLSLSPALVVPEDVSGLLAEGLSPEDLVVTGQVVAFTVFQARLTAGLRLLAGHDPGSEVTAAAELAIGRAKRHPEQAANGRPAPAGYTRSVLGWAPWVPALSEEELTDRQRESFAGKPGIDYFRLLAREPEVLVARTRVDDAIFLSADGLPRAERELAATATSKVNDCVFCASVHARQAARLAKREEDVDRLLAVDVPRRPGWTATDPAALATLSAGQRPRWAAVIGLAAAVAAGSWSAAAAPLGRLRDLGVPDAELIDLVGAAAFFSWANRLMLTLGEPFLPERLVAGKAPVTGKAR